jgi:hypothetical protein
MVVFHTSFIRLLERVQQERWHDTPECLYHFFTVARVEDIIGSAGLVGCSFDKVERTLLQLVRAEQDGRVSWRIGPYGGELETERFRNLLEKAREMGARIPICDRAAAERICMWQARIRMFLSHSVLLGHRLP